MKEFNRELIFLISVFIVFGREKEISAKNPTEAPKSWSVTAPTASSSSTSVNIPFISGDKIFLKKKTVLMRFKKAYLNFCCISWNKGISAKNIKIFNQYTYNITPIALTVHISFTCGAKIKKKNNINASFSRYRVSKFSRKYLLNHLF